MPMTEAERKRLAELEAWRTQQLGFNKQVRDKLWPPITLRRSDSGQASDVTKVTRSGATGTVTPNPPPPPPASYPAVPAGFTTIQNAVNNYTVPFSVPAGTYNETVTITTNGLEMWGLPGAIINGQGTRQYGLIINATDVKIKGEFQVTNCVPPSQNGAVRVLRDRCTMTGLRSHNHGGLGCGITVRDSGFHLIEDVEFDNCVQAGWHATNVNNSTFRNWYVHENNLLKLVEPGFEAGVGKLSYSNDIVFEDGLAENVWGHGWWADIDNSNITFRRMRAHHISHSGIFYEISDGMSFIEDCVIWECGWDGGSWGYGAGIQVSASRNVTVQRNTVAWCNRGISVIAQDRGAWPTTSPGNYDGIQVINNVIVNSTGSWLHNWVEDRAPYTRLFSYSNNGGSGNRYWSAVSEPQFDRFGWQGSKSDLAAFNATPGEQGGVYMTTAERDAYLTPRGVPLSR